MHTTTTTQTPAAKQAPVKLYRIAEVARMLGVCRATVYNLVRDDRLTLVKIGRRASGITAVSVEALVSRSNNTSESGS
ncbi:helix-turn-helix domain-containing protein [Burkholderia cenocepacia]|uniref:helix-turn-helix transcriptional regulator n=1 Tax=Burkholderia cenocepacia TaxID=95486 RepID=UPI0028570157|nr:helix-turn-helix domain-containing protein [Burkholderia cenocepacia]MDR8077808.1 helix-turn-helix domain-containing protein [Burkholderia cenocepacia]